MLFLLIVSSLFTGVCNLSKQLLYELIHLFLTIQLESQCTLAENLAMLMASLSDSLFAQFLQLLCRAALQDYPLFEVSGSL